MRSQEGAGGGRGQPLKRFDADLVAHLLGPHALEVINLFALAIRSRVPASDLKHQLYAYPTSGSDVPYLL